MATVKIVRTKASDDQIKSFNLSTFGAGGYALPSNTKLMVEAVEIISHTVDGNPSSNGVPVIKLKDREEVIYIRGLIKTRYDHKSERVETKGTLNQFVQTLIGKTGEEVLQAIREKIVGKEITALLLTYRGINRNGDVQMIEYNEYNL